MLKNYLKIGFRNIWRHKGYSLINIMGLGIGIACCTLILLHVADEFSYDRQHEQADRIYRMALERIYPEHTRHYAIIPAGFSEVVAKDFPEVEKATRLFTAFGGGVVFQKGDDIYEEKEVMFADSNVFDIFTMPLVEGDAQTALNKPNSVILTVSTAKRYFGTQNILGEQLKSDFGDLIITGIAEDIPENSHFTFDLLLSSGSLGFLQRPNYISFSALTYLLLDPAADPTHVESKFPKLVEQYAAGQIQAQLNMDYAAYTAAGNGYRYSLQALPDIHLKSQLESEARPNGNITYVYMFIGIAFFILLLACINFMNLATARSSERAREVGVRKVLGSLKKQLVGQFLVESVAVSLISLFVGVGLVRMALPYFNELAEKSLEFHIAEPVWLIPVMLTFSVVVGLLAGLYPAFVLSSFRPVVVLKGNFKSSKQGTFLRNGLVVFQFFISIVLIAATMVIYRQMEFMQDKNLGFNKDQTVIVERYATLQEKAEPFKEELLKHPQITHAAGSNALPGDYYFGFFVQTSPGTEPVTTSAMIMDEDYIETLGMEVSDGRAFSRAFNDSLSILLNETAVRELGIEDPIGKPLYSQGNGGANNELVKYTIVGVVKDYHFQSLHQKISPVVMLSHEGQNGNMPRLAIHLKAGNTAETVSFIADKWAEMNPEQPFNYRFFDEKLDELYVSEMRVRRISTVFSGLAVLIACIGLFGLSAFMAQARTKEIGIRKVLGASVGNIVILLSKHFTLLVVLSVIVAIPIIYLLGNSWLEGFAYRIDILPWKQPLPYFLSGLMALAIAWLTVSFQSIKAAIANPVKALKDE